MAALHEEGQGGEVTALSWSISSLALLGVVLNIRKHPACFAIWMFTNAAWAVIDLAHGIYAQATLMAIYCMLSVYGFWSWALVGRKKEVLK